MTETVESAPDARGLGRRWWVPRRGRDRVAAVIGAAVVVVGVVLRFYAPTPLWLDETISVNISRLPIGQIPTALSHDGAPPVYYLLLHAWMLAFGQGDVAVRALSGIVSVAALPLFWCAGRRLGGRTVAWVTFFLGVTSPFAIYYATSARMYSLMTLWCLLGFLALGRALEAPTRSRLVQLGLVVAAILYTHYWGLYLVAVTGAWLLYQLWRGRRGLPLTAERRALRRSFVAVAAGSLLFVPWAPIFVFQTLHTGTPWTSAAGPSDLLHIFGDYAGSGPWGGLLAFVYFGLVVLGVFGRRARDRVDTVSAMEPSSASTAGPTPSAATERPGGTDLAAAGLEEPAPHPGWAGRARSLADRAVGFAGFGPGGAGASVRRRESSGVTLVLQPNRRATPVFGVLAGTLVLAVVAGAVAQAAFVARYAAAVLPLFLLVVGLGVTVLSHRRLVGGTLAVMCVAGLLTGLGNNAEARTQAVQIAQVLNAQAQPGDLVLYCPDQLGPAVDRLLTVPAVGELTFPRAIGAQRVDWVDYKATIAATNVETFAQDMLARLGAGHTLWLVWRDGYPGFGGDCGALQSWLSLLQGQGSTLVHASARFYEYENLTRYPT